MIAVITTTLNEEQNIARLIKEVHESLKEDYVLVVVDDNSKDRTQGIVLGLSGKYPVKLVKRPYKMGIASAIVDGIKAQPADYYIIMEADLTHPPIKLLQLRHFLKKYDLVVMSRRVKDGRIEGWPLSRKIVSLGANFISRPLTPIKDRTTGFIGIQSRCLEGVELNPIGMHFAIECFVKANYANYIELPYVFIHRSKGKSKFNYKECIIYLKHMCKLYKFKATCVE